MNKEIKDDLNANCTFAVQFYNFIPFALEINVIKLLYPFLKDKTSHSVCHFHYC